MTRRPSARARAALLGAALLLAAPAARGQTFDFEGVPFMPTSFTLTSGGVSASFGSPGQPFFEILAYPAGAFAGLSGQVLGTPSGTADIVGLQSLGIDFSTPLSSIALDFALTSAIPGTELTLAAFLGATSVGGTTVVAGAGPNFPEGTLTFGGVAFDRVVLTPDAGDFAIDDVGVTVAPTAIPEPATVALLGTALGALALVAASRRRR